MRGGGGKQASPTAAKFNEKREEGKSLEATQAGTKIWDFFFGKRCNNLCYSIQRNDGSKKKITKAYTAVGARFSRT